MIFAYRSAICSIFITKTFTYFCCFRVKFSYVLLCLLLAWGGQLPLRGCHIAICSQALGSAPLELKEPWENSVIHSISIEGLWRMQEHVIVRELLIAPGQKMTKKLLENSLQKVRNLRTVHRAEARIAFLKSGEIDVVIEVGERWAIIPVARFGGGGGSSFFVLGAYDMNFMGQYLEFGGQYMNYNNAHGGMLWFRDPRVLNEHQSIYLVVANTGKPQVVYDTKNRDPGTSSTQAVGAFVKRSQEIKVEYFRNLTDWFGLGIDYEVATVSFPLRKLTKKQNEINYRFNFRAPNSQKRYVQGTTLSFGRINTTSYLLEGVELSSKASFAKKSFLSEDEFAKFSLQLQAYYLAIGKQNIAGKLYLGSVSNTGLVNQHYVGGVDAIRGFYDGEFQGRQAWTSNFEYRVPSLQLEQFVLQHIAFLDAGNAGNNWNEVFPVNSKTPLSVGTGLRFISPPVARLTARLDFSWTLQHRKGYGIVFGMQQFF